MVIITRKCKSKKTVVIKFTIGIINNQKPIIGIEKDVTEMWNKLKKINNKKLKQKTKKSNFKKSTSEVQVLNEVKKNVEIKNNNKSIVEDKCIKSNSISDVMNKFKNMEIKEKESKKMDVYSSDYKPIRLKKDDPEYGTPIPGTLTELRAKKASKHIKKEMDIVCQVIKEYGKVNKKTGYIEITFGELFNVYTNISDKVVGILLRARKHNMVHFEGEMLFQRRDENKIITLLLNHNDT
uniref:Costars domain-containing protein n=1 Tax=Strongyloides stercoralis TaxID=6248 RepID=A0A0K0E3G4_STRER